MTQPALAKRGGGRYDSPRIYSWPPVAPHEFEVISVTSAISAGWPKPFLIGWAAKRTAECAVEDHDIVAAMLKKGDTSAAIAHLKGARYRDTAEKADRGTIVHAAVEAYLNEKPLTKEQVEEMLKERRVPVDMWRSTARMIAGAMEFLWEREPQVSWSEATVFSREHGYAGTADILGFMNLGGDNPVPVIIDFKTSKSIYDDTALQLVAYARADFVGLTDGTEIPLVSDTGESVFGERHPEYGVVVRPTPGGTFELATFVLNDDLFDTFLGVLSTAKGVDTVSAARRPS